MSEGFSKEDFKQLVSLIEDGELDEYFLPLREAIDDRLKRQKDAVMKLVKATFGDNARVVEGQVVTGPQDSPVPVQPPSEVVLPDGTVIKEDLPDTPPAGIPQPNEPPMQGQPDLLDDMPGEYITKGATFGDVR